MLAGEVRLCLRRDASRSAPEARPETRPETAVPGRRALVCARCGQRITSDAARTTVGGQHEHTKANPHGYVFHIGCFAMAVGLVPWGPPSTAWTWFPGYSWQVERCAGCEEHIGWQFDSPGHGFHGLILDRLAEAEERPS